MSKKAINCSVCTNYYCKKIAENGGYRFWGCLLKFLYNDLGPKKLMRELANEAQRFLPEHTFYWDCCGLCLCKLPYGDYIWHFAVQMKQQSLWNYREFKEGYKFGLNPQEPYRDANPHLEPSRNMSWDCGYILGLHEHSKGKDAK